MQLAITVIALVSVIAYLALRLKYEVQMAQQNSYRVRRYGHWLVGDISSTVRITDLMLAVLLAAFWHNVWAVGGVAVIAILKITKELTRKYKKPLVFTHRVYRILSVDAVLVVLAVVLCGVLRSPDWALMAALLAVVLSPIVTIVALVILWPVEASINRWYYNDARRILAQMPELVVIGITGSYGKTSTKHYLYRILSEKYNVLMTPGSYNTTMGVIRTVREQLKPYHNIFIVEMGAKQQGDVAEICRLVKPTIGILTAVGEQHLESFGSIENVQRAKFELIDALPKDGLAVLNDDFEWVANRNVTNVDRVVRYGTAGDWRITDTRYEAVSTKFTITDKSGGTLALETQLVGRYNLSNVLAGCIVARSLGMTDNEIKVSVADIRQVEHRLNMRLAGGLTIIDDAYNANPHGAAMALEVLASFEGVRRILITPGMIELGSKQEQYNRDFGATAAHSCDYAIVVGEYNRDAIVGGLKGEDFDAEHIFAVDTFAQATARLSNLARRGDVVLYENDLPDTFK